MRRTITDSPRAAAAALTLLAASAAPATAQQPTPAPVEEHALPFDLRLSVSTSSTKRTLDAGGALSDATTNLRGAEGRFSGRSAGMGIFGKYYDGTVNDQRVTWTEGGLFLGAREFAIEGAYVRRATPGVDSTFDFAKAGLRTMVTVGGTGVYAVFAGAGYIPFRKLKGSDAKRERGWEGETGIGYVAPRIPVFVQLGYRFEHFGVRESTENLSGITLSTGVWFGGR